MIINACASIRPMQFANTRGRSLMRHLFIRIPMHGSVHKVLLCPLLYMCVYSGFCCAMAPRRLGPGRPHGIRQLWYTCPCRSPVKSVFMPACADVDFISLSCILHYEWTFAASYTMTMCLPLVTLLILIARGYFFGLDKNRIIQV